MQPPAIERYDCTVTNIFNGLLQKIMINPTELILRLLLAAFLGSVIGFERERLSWAAGLRTHMLVCVGSALLMMVSAFGFSDVLGKPHVELDPSRIAAQVVSGIGFLGAGSIMARGEVIRGLTTAASLWTVAAVGLAVGGGLYVGAVAATAIILIILAGLKPLEKWYFQSRQRRELLLKANRGSITMQILERALRMDGSRIEQFIVQPHDDDPTVDKVSIIFSRVSGSEFDMIRQNMQRIDGVQLLDQSQ